MTMLSILLVILNIVIANDVVFGSEPLQTGQDITGPSSAKVLLLALCVLVCCVTLLFGCVKIRDFIRSFCPNQSSFKDFDNDDAFFSDISISTVPPVQFPMYPPIESTVETRSTGNIYFEPLPDIAARYQSRRMASAMNTIRLRPKLSQIGRERIDSDDDGECIQADFVEEMAKLEKITNIIHRANSQRQFPRTQLQYIKELGSGWFGKVLQGEGQGILPGHRKTKVVVQMLKEDVDLHEKLAFLHEGSAYRDVDNPNVLKLFSQCIETIPYLTVLEFCPLGDLKSYLRSQRGSIEMFDRQGLLLNFACDMAAGLQAMHQANYTHRDFAARNCLVASDLSIKVGDYGMSENVFKEDYMIDKNDCAIPVRWMAPETIEWTEGHLFVKTIPRESNIWSFGIALWELAKFGELPYTDLSNENVLRLVITEQSVKLSKPDVNISNLDRMYELMLMCWNEVSQRPSLRELRIMLLHLRSNKDQIDTSAFDQKWNQLMPRQTQPLSVLDDASITSSSDTRSKRTVTGHDTGSDFGTDVYVVRPSSLCSDFSEQRSPSSLTAHAGSLQASTRSATPTTATPDSSVPPHDLISPVNELSLAAELGTLGPKGNFSGKEDSDFEILSLDETASKSIGTAMGSSNAGFADDEYDSERGVIRHRAEVHKSLNDEPDPVSELGSGYTNASVSGEDSARAESPSWIDLKDQRPGSNGLEDKENDTLFRPINANENFKSSTPNLLTEQEAFVSPDCDESNSSSYVTVSPFQEDKCNNTINNTQFLSANDGFSLTSDIEDRSFLRPKKYTDYLQTVMTSIDGDDNEFEKLSSLVEPRLDESSVGAGFEDIASTSFSHNSTEQKEA